MSAKKLRWADLPSDYPMSLMSRRRVMGERMMLSEVRLEPGFVLESHSHFNEQFVVVLSGRCVFQVGREDGSTVEIEMQGGEVLHLPGNVPHGVRVIEATHILDIFSPISEKTGVDRA
ncbi:hypothetical protein PHYC_01856 [Phycisphaerales bacterium]|nr:hypothetical protein PHYC_01856 [Phycisphaerales bacterium]